MLNAPYAALRIKRQCARVELLADAVHYPFAQDARLHPDLPLHSYDDCCRSVVHTPPDDSKASNHSYTGLRDFKASRRRCHARDTFF
jgi:hypothetical protein